MVPAQFGLAVGEYAPKRGEEDGGGRGPRRQGAGGSHGEAAVSGVKVAGPDAADALAVAICHAHHVQSSGRLAAA